MIQYLFRHETSFYLKWSQPGDEGCLLRIINREQPRTGGPTACGLDGVLKFPRRQNYHVTLGLVIHGPLKIQ